MNTRDIEANRVPSGSLVTIEKVCSSSARVSVTSANNGASALSSSINRSNDAFTSSAVNGVPSLNVTSSRRVKVRVSSSSEYSHDSASSGWASPSL